MHIIRVLRVVAALAGVIPAVSLAGPALGQELPFTETFDDPTLPRWEHSPNATVVDGALHIGPDGFAFHPARWSDMSLAVRARCLGEGELLIRYRWSEDANYSVRLRPDRVAVQRQLLGPPEDLGGAPASIPPGEWVEVTVTVTGGTHHVTLNGSPVLTATDPDPLLEGGIGLLVQGEAAGEFDSLELTAGGQAPPPVEVTPMPEPTSVAPPPIAPAGIPAYQAASWLCLGGPPGGLGYDIRYKFDDPDTWYVTDSYTGFFISHDRGLTWEPSNEGINRLEGTTIVPIFSATVDPHNPDVIWIGTQFSGHIYKSTDGGLTWTQMDNGVEPNQGHSFRGFTIDPRSSDIVYAAAEVEITNDQTGHHVPTDFPGRHLILLVLATDADANALTQLDGSQVPDWGGVGEPSEGYYAGLPGKAFAKVLQEIWTEISPSAAYWNPTRVLSDNRLAAFATDSSTYTFAAPEEGEVKVEVTLLFRRAFLELMHQKGWDVPDKIMEQQEVRIPLAGE